jgi:hypothetical protein
MGVEITVLESILVGLFFGALVVGWSYADRRDARRRRPGAHAGPRLPSSADAVSVLRSHRTASGPAGRAGSRPGVAGALMTGSDDATGPITLRTWLVHLHPGGGNLWAEVVQEFLDAVSSDPDITAYFGGDERRIRQHFLSVLIALADGGVPGPRLEALRARHSAVRDGAGHPISAVAFDAATGALIDVLRGKGVPYSGLGQLALALAELRPSVVPDSAPHAMAAR